MRRLRAFWSGILVAGIAFFTVGPAQISSPASSHDDSISAGRRFSALFVPAYDRNGRPVPTSGQAYTSGNWSGYVVGTGTTGNYASASFSWIVQSAAYVNYGNANLEISAQWVGIGGFNTSDLIQLGSNSSVDNTGAATYNAWYEMLPADEIPLSGCTPVALSSCPVSPGDIMSASLACTAECTPNNSNTQWTLSMTNSTKGWSWTESFTYLSSLSTAEWIEEAVTNNGQITGMPNFGTGPFSSLLVNGVSPNLNLSTNGIFLSDTTGGGFAEPCQAFDGNQVGSGNAFVVAYGHACITTFDAHDYNNDAHSDIAWRDENGNIALWLMNGTSVISTGSIGGVPSSTWSIVGQRDFNADGYVDLLWQDTSGDIAIWFMKGSQVLSAQGVGNVPNWSVVGTGDFNGDGRGDILWEDKNGNLAVWLMNGATVISSAVIGSVPFGVWTVAGIADFDNNDMSDILWRDTSGNIAIWFMNGTQVSSAKAMGNVPTNWSIVGTGDFNSDGNADIAWRDATGDTAIWLLEGAEVFYTGALGNVPTTWSIVQTGDYNGDGYSDLLWRDKLGNTAIWFMNRCGSFCATVASTGAVGNVPTNWTVQSVNAE
jgi:hypothetical protein